jgi:hypothetical protein
MKAWKLGGGLVIGTSLLLAATACAPLQEGQPLEAAQAVEPAAGLETGIYVSPAGLAEIQRRLNEAGYAAGHVDGVWGAEVSSAVAQFQRDRDLDATGTLTFETIHALDLGGLLTGEGMPQPVAGVGPLEEPEQQ